MSLNHSCFFIQCLQRSCFVEFFQVFIFPNKNCENWLFVRIPGEPAGGSVLRPPTAPSWKRSLNAVINSNTTQRIDLSPSALYNFRFRHHRIQCLNIRQLRILNRVLLELENKAIIYFESIVFMEAFRTLAVNVIVFDHKFAPTTPKVVLFHDIRYLHKASAPRYLRKSAFLRLRGSVDA